MSDQDPVESLLRTAPISDRLKASAWDVFQASSDEDDLAARLKDLPIPDDVKANLWDAKHTAGGGGAMNFAVVNGKQVPLDTESSGPVERFVAGAARANPVTNTIDTISRLMHDPVKAAGEIVLDPSEPYVNAAKTAYQAGKPLEALGEAASAVPMIGPYVRGGVDRMRAGDVAGGLGELSWLAAPLLKKGGKVALEGAKKLPGAASVFNPMAELADKISTNKIADVMAPDVGANKVRFGKMAADVAPAIARDPALGALTRDGLFNGVKKRFAQAQAGLDAAADARNAGKPIPTKPIIADLIKRRQKLVAEAAQGNNIGYQRITVKGKPVSTWIKNQGPMGADVVPAEFRPGYDQLTRMITEVQQLGPVAHYEALRRLRQAWDQGAKEIYTPSVSQDFMKARGRGLASADGAAAVREHLAKVDPATAAANADYAIYKAAHDVLSATEEIERVRPTKGRDIASAVGGAASGAAVHGVEGAAIGGLVGPLVERAIAAAPTMKIVIARRLASVADALRVGDAPRAQRTLQSVAQSLPAVKTGLKVVGKSAAMLGRSMQLPEALAAEQREQARRTAGAAGR